MKIYSSVLPQAFRSIVKDKVTYLDTDGKKYKAYVTHTGTKKNYLGTAYYAYTISGRRKPGSPVTLAYVRTDPAGIMKRRACVHWEYRLLGALFFTGTTDVVSRAYVLKHRITKASHGFNSTNKKITLSAKNKGHHCVCSTVTVTVAEGSPGTIWLGTPGDTCPPLPGTSLSLTKNRTPFLAAVSTFYYLEDIYARVLPYVRSTLAPAPEIAVAEATPRLVRAHPELAGLTRPQIEDWLLWSRWRDACAGGRVSFRTARVISTLTHTRTEYTRWLARQMYDYMCLACLCEARFYKVVSGWNMTDYSRQDASSRVLKYSPIQAMPVLVRLYHDFKWKSGFGGAAWGRIAEAAQRYHTLPPEVFVDEVVDITHNGGLAWNKEFIFTDPDADSEIIRVLNVKREGGLFGKEEYKAMIDPEIRMTLREVMGEEKIPNLPGRFPSQITNVSITRNPALAWGRKPLVLEVDRYGKITKEEKAAQAGKSDPGWLPGPRA